MVGWADDENQGGGELGPGLELGLVQERVVLTRLSHLTVLETILGRMGYKGQQRVLPGECITPKAVRRIGKSWI